MADWTGTRETVRIDTVVDDIVVIGKPESRLVLRSHQLERVPPSAIERDCVVIFDEKGFAPHIEVICRLRGVALAARRETSDSASGLVVQRKVHGSALRFAASFPGAYQVSVYSPDDLDHFDFSSIGSVFVRMEHLLYRALNEDGSLPRGSVLMQRLAEDLIRFAERTPDAVRLLVRGADVRSDDPMLGDEFHFQPESNPELGAHGAHWLLAHPDWLDMEAELLHGLGRENLSYSLPFVTNWNGWHDFASTHSHRFPSAGAFLESPATLLSLETAALNIPICIGLKDITQFYFGVDRGNPAVASIVDFRDSGLMAMVRSFIARVGQSPSGPVAVHQQLSSLASYGSMLPPWAWMPSLPQGEFKILGSIR